jgi:cytochrome c
MARSWFVLITACGMLACNRTPTPTPEQAKRMLRTTGCTNCHDKDRPLVGPPFSVVAARYAGQPDAEATLSRTLAEGSTGKWGKFPMPPQTRLEPEEKKAMIRWILALAPRR